MFSTQFGGNDYYGGAERSAGMVLFWCAVAVVGTVLILWAASEFAGLDLGGLFNISPNSRRPMMSGSDSFMPQPNYKCPVHADSAIYPAGMCLRHTGVRVGVFNKSSKTDNKKYGCTCPCKCKNGQTVANINMSTTVNQLKDIASSTWNTAVGQTQKKLQTIDTSNAINFVNGVVEFPKNVENKVGPTGGVVNTRYSPGLSGGTSRRYPFF